MSKMVGPGDRVGERYQVIEQLASGGMGVLWRARHLELDVDVALKVISSNAGDPEVLARFKREAQAAARLRSPNIVQVFDYGVIDSKAFFVMELLRGEDLATCLAREGKLAPARCARIVEGMARAIQLAHDEGLVHRDLKPANIFLERHGNNELVKVLDFGIAKDLTASERGATTSSGTLLGSPAYMSPEQVWNEGVGCASDVWAMGVVAFEMLTGKNPFADETLARVFERIVREPLPNVRQLNANLPEAVDAFFARAFSRATDQRVASAREFAYQFRSAILDRSPAALTSEPPLEHMDAQYSAAGEQAQSPRPALRRTLVAAGLILLMAVLGLAVYGRKRMHQTTTIRRPSTPPAAAAPDLAGAPPSAAEPLTTPNASIGELTTPNASIRDLTPPQRPRRSRKVAAPQLPAPPATDPRFGIPISP